MAFHLVILPDGGVLLANGVSGVVRLNASGDQIQTYRVAEINLWGGVDCADRTCTSFWATNAWTDR